MREQYILDVKNINKLKEGLLRFGNQYNTFVFLDSNNFTYNSNSNHSYFEYDFLAAFSVHDKPKKDDFPGLKAFTKEHEDWVFGFLATTLKTILKI